MDKKLLQKIECFIAVHYVDPNRPRGTRRFSIRPVTPEPPPPPPPPPPPFGERLMKFFNEKFLHRNDTFSERLMYLIKKSGMSEVEVYKKAHLDRRLFSKIRSDKDYRPSRNTAIVLALALELDVEAANDLLNRGGHHLSNERKDDVIIRYFLEEERRDLTVINEVLEYYGLPLLN